MTLTNRQRGDYFERQTRDALLALGWHVTRAAGSLGVADLVALRADAKPLLVSCKLNGYIGPAERADLHAAARAAGARPLVAHRPRDGWVELRAVTPQAPSALTHVDTIKVPSRKKAPHADDARSLEDAL